LDAVEAAAAAVDQIGNQRLDLVKQKRTLLPLSNESNTEWCLKRICISEKSRADLKSRTRFKQNESIDYAAQFTNANLKTEKSS
jgi:hypothetical protein